MSLTGQLLRKLRNEHNYTMQYIADMLSISKAAVSKWENGNEISVEHLYELSKLYNVSFSDLYYGKLNSENNADFVKRNYNLSFCDLKDAIDLEDNETIKTFFERCNIVKERFFSLLPLWASNKLSNIEEIEFKFLKKYFKFDVYYYALKKNTESVIINLPEQSEREFVVWIITEIQSQEKIAYRWELTKLYDFNYNDQRKEIFESQNSKAFEYMLTSLSQIEKDWLLYNYLKAASLEKEIDSFGRVLIKSGANVLYGRKFPSSSLEPEMLKVVDGKVVEVDNSIYEKYLFYNVAGQEDVAIFSNWKRFSYQEYLQFIDKKKTEWITDIVNLRDSDPLLYFEKMVKRNKI